MSSIASTAQPVAAAAGCTPVVVYGCHGGAGATILTAHLGSAREAGPITPDTLSLAAGRAVVVVARGTVAGSRLAIDAAAALQAAGAATIVVAVVADGPWAEPLAVRARLRALSGHVPVVRVPYIARWRFEDTPSFIPACYERALARLRDAYCACRDGHLANQATA